MTWMKEFLFTLSLVASLLVMCAAIMVVAGYFECIGIGLAVMLIAILAFIYHSARWFAYRTPHAKDVNRFKWTAANEDSMESCVENAIVYSRQIKTTIMRVSIYNRTKRKRSKRLLIGDDATFLGRNTDGFWFLIQDRFYSRKDGLVCVDRQTGEILFHQPKKQIEMDDDDAVAAAFKAAKEQLADQGKKK